jgi:hypothetical protein
MSIFDKQQGFKTLDEDYGERSFIILDGWTRGTIETQFGPRDAAEIVVAADLSDIPDAVANAKMYMVWGALAKQVAAMEAGELPCHMGVEKGRPNSFVPADPPLASGMREQLTHAYRNSGVKAQGSLSV